MSDFNRKTQKLLNILGASPRLTEDGDAGPKTTAAMDKELAKHEPAPGPLPAGKSPPWFLEAKKHEGKKETDPAFNKEMSKKWSLFGMNLGTIQKSWAAWCGLFVAVALATGGFDHLKSGALARNWGVYGVQIEWKTDGIPQGAIVHINHKGNCSSGSSNHVAFADGDCTAADLLKKNATINLYGGNQANTAKVSTYPVWEICNVRWPKEYPKRGRITQSLKCTSGSAGSESTR